MNEPKSCVKPHTSTLHSRHTNNVLAFITLYKYPIRILIQLKRFLPVYEHMVRIHFQISFNNRLEIDVMSKSQTTTHTRQEEDKSGEC